MLCSSDRLETLNKRIQCKIHGRVGCLELPFRIVFSCVDLARCVDAMFWLLFFKQRSLGKQDVVHARYATPKGCACVDSPCGKNLHLFVHSFHS